MIVNIGLYKGRTTERIPADEVVKAIKEIGGFVEAGRVAQSSTEPTFVASVRGLSDADVYKLAKIFEQEAIAVKDENGGRLIGPKAHLWGSFNEEYFINK